MQTLILEQGRPVDVSCRTKTEVRCYDLLDKLGIAYSRVDHEKADTMEVCQKIDKALGAPICKNLFLCNRQQTVFYLLMMPGSKPFKTKELSGQLGVSRLSFATPEHMKKYLNITPGSVSVFGLMNDTENRVRLIVDVDLLEEAYVGCHPCINTSSIKLRTEDVLKKLVPAFGHTVTYVKLVGEA